MYLEVEMPGHKAQSVQVICVQASIMSWCLATTGSPALGPPELSVWAQLLCSHPREPCDLGAHLSCPGWLPGPRTPAVLSSGWIPNVSFPAPPSASYSLSGIGVEASCASSLVQCSLRLHLAFPGWSRGRQGVVVHLRCGPGKPCDRTQVTRLPRRFCVPVEGGTATCSH